MSKKKVLRPGDIVRIDKSIYLVCKIFDDNDFVYLVDLKTGEFLFNDDEYDRDEAESEEDDAGFMWGPTSDDTDYFWDAYPRAEIVGVAKEIQVD